jgi:hypothetical protein
MVNNGELIGTTEYLTLWARCRINRYRYNRVPAYLEKTCQWHLLYHRSHMDWAGIEPGPPRWEIGGQPPAKMSVNQSRRQATVGMLYVTLHTLHAVALHIQFHYQPLHNNYFLLLHVSAHHLSHDHGVIFQTCAAYSMSRNGNMYINYLQQSLLYSTKKFIQFKLS